MSVNHDRLGRQVKLSSPVAFFGQERSTVDHAFAGDIIGLINPGVFQLGDALSAGPPPEFRGVPRFAPEMFARLVPTDTGKLKQFRKGLEELSEEGVVQVFQSADNQTVLGAVGQLQFDVFAFRLQDEYGAPCRLEPLGFERSRWVRETDRTKFSAYDMFLKDMEGRPVVLFKSEYRMQSFQKNNPEVELFEHPPAA